MSSRLFLLGCYAFISLGVSAGVLGPGLNTLAHYSQISLDQTGTIFTAMAVGYLLSAPLISLLGPRIGVRNMLIFSPLLGALSMVMFAMGRTLPMQWLSAVLLGISQSGTQVGYNAMFGTGPNSSRQLNQINAFFGIGALTAPLVASFGYQQFGEATIAFMVAAVMTLPLTIGAFLWRGGIPARATSTSASTKAAHAPQPRPVHPVGGNLREPMRHSVFWLICTVMAVYVGCEVAFSGWTTEFTRQGLNISVAQAAASTSAFYVGLALSRYFSNSVLRVPPATLVLIVLLVALAGYAVMLVATVSAGANSMGLPLVLAGAFVVGAGMGPIYPTLISIAIQRFPRHATPLASILTSSGSAGALFLPSLVGTVLATQSALAAWGLQMVLLVLILGLLLAVRNELKHQPRMQ